MLYVHLPAPLGQRDFNCYWNGLAYCGSLFVCLTIPSSMNWKFILKVHEFITNN